jgi:hypothetical protein
MRRRTAEAAPLRARVAVSMAYRARRLSEGSSTWSERITPWGPATRPKVTDHSPQIERGAVLRGADLMGECGRPRLRPRA